MKLEIRKIVTFEEEIFFEGGKKASQPLKLFGVAAVVKNPWSGRGFVDDLKGVGRPFPTNRFYWTDLIDYFINYSNEEKLKLDVYGKEYNLKTDEGKIHFAEDVKEYLKNSFLLFYF